MARTEELVMRYVGYNDRTFVPKRNQKSWLHRQGEEETKKMLCLLNKIGNAQGANCRVEYLGSQTMEMRATGRLKRNHYMYLLLVEYQRDDDKIFLHHLKSRTGQSVGISVDDNGGCASGSCNGGFCD